MNWKAERRSHADIGPGLLFSFGEDPDPVVAWERRRFPQMYSRRTLKNNDHQRRVWLVVSSRYVQKLSGGYLEYLCLGDDNRVRWLAVANRWIHRLVDPLGWQRGEDDARDD